MKTLIIICSLFIPVTSYCQTQQDSTLFFEKHKKSLNQPLTQFTKVPQPDVPGKELAGKMVIYMGKNADSVRAIFEGKIGSIAQVGDAYIVITRYGNYYISYYGLSKPHLIEGSTVKRDQFISQLSIGSFGQPFLMIQVYKDNTEVDPNEWFK